MPSGPRSYGGGGSRGRSGGFSSSRGSSYRSHGSRPRGPVRPFRFHFGTRVYVVANKAMSIISLLLFVVLFAGVFAYINYCDMDSHKAYLNSMKADEAYYTRLIETGTVVDAEIKDEYEAFYYEGYYYYQIEYRYTNSNGKSCVGKTYANYTLAQIDYMNGEIEIAYDESGVSIPTAYVLEDIEFQYYSSELKSSRIQFILSITVIVLVIGLGVFIFIKNAKKEEQEKLEAQEKERAEQEALKPKFCEYCGAKIKAEDVKCENCGARVD